MKNRRTARTGKGPADFSFNTGCFFDEILVTFRRRPVFAGLRPITKKLSLNENKFTGVLNYSPVFDTYR